MFAFLWILILGYFQHTNSGYVEIVEKTSCDTCKLMLTCRSLTSVIAILKVDFLQDSPDESLAGSLARGLAGNSAGNSSVASGPFPPIHPRDVLNQRCSGLNFCSFILSEDCPGSDIFGRGNITIKYACVSQDRIKKYCNSDIVLPLGYTSHRSEGFIHNPGYPRFYSGHKECRWRIIGRGDQRIRVTILDISLIVDNVDSSLDCTDVLEIRDTGQIIHSACVQQHPPTEIVSGSESIEIVLSSKQEFNPRRGFLIHYSVVGCVEEPPVPRGAYLVFRTPYLIVFNCCSGYNFPDTGTRTKSIGCHGANWNTSLPLLDCQRSSLPTHWNLTESTIKIVGKHQAMALDFLAPALLILALFVINGAVVYFIHKARKKQELEDSIKGEELDTFTVSPH